MIYTEPMPTRGPKPKPKSEHLINVGLKVSRPILTELLEIVPKEKRTKSDLARLLFMRGLVGYRRDGKLIEPEDVPKVVPLKIVGRVSGGKPIEAIENVEEILVLSTDVEGVKRPHALRVVGDSMRDANVMDGDIILVGDCESPINRIVVALIKDKGTVDATLKMWRQNGHSVTLEPANPDYEPITLPLKKVDWYGMLIKVLRTFGNMNEQAEAKDAA